MKIFLRLVQYVLRYKARLGLIFLLSLLGIVVELARPWPVKLVVDYVLANRPLPEALQPLLRILPGGTAQGGLLVWCVIGACAIILFAGGLYLVVLNTTVRLAQRLVLDLSRDLFDKLQRLSLAYHGRHSVGDLLERMSSDVFVVHSIVSPVGLPGTISTLTLIGMFIVMANLDLGLSLIALVVIPVLAVSLALFVRPINSTATRQWE